MPLGCVHLVALRVSAGKRCCRTFVAPLTRRATKSRPAASILSAPSASSAVGSIAFLRPRDRASAAKRIVIGFGFMPGFPAETRRAAACPCPVGNKGRNGRRRGGRVRPVRRGRVNRGGRGRPPHRSRGHGR